MKSSGHTLVGLRIVRGEGEAASMSAPIRLYNAFAKVGSDT